MLFKIWRNFIFLSYLFTISLILFKTTLSANSVNKNKSPKWYFNESSRIKPRTNYEAKANKMSRRNVNLGVPLDVFPTIGASRKVMEVQPETNIFNSKSRTLFKPNESKILSRNVNVGVPLDVLSTRGPKKIVEVEPVSNTFNTFNSQPRNLSDPKGSKSLRRNVNFGVPLDIFSIRPPRKMVRKLEPISRIIRRNNGKTPIIIYEATESRVQPRDRFITASKNIQSGFAPSQAFPFSNRISPVLNNLGFALSIEQDDFLGDDIDDFHENRFFNRLLHHNLHQTNNPNRVQNNINRPNVQTGVPLPGLKFHPNSKQIGTTKNLIRPHVPRRNHQGFFPSRTFPSIKTSFESREDFFDDFDDFSSEYSRPFGFSLGNRNSNTNRFQNSAVQRYHWRQNGFLRPKYPSRTPNYSFGYRVATHGHQETRRGNRVEGSYHVDLPNGLRQIVRYYADETGYHPTITYERIHKYFTQKIVSSPSATTVVKLNSTGVKSSIKSDKDTNWHAIRFPLYERYANPPIRNTTPSASPSAGVPSMLSPSGTAKNLYKNISSYDTNGDSKMDKENTSYRPPSFIDPKFIRKSSKPSDTNSTVTIN